MKKSFNAVMAAAVALLGAPAAGEAQQGATVPLEYVQLVLSAGLMGEAPPELAVGEVPDWLASLPGARPVGSAHGTGYSVSTVVVPGRGADAAAQLRAALEANGWVRPPATGRMARGGFVEAQEQPLESYLCDAAGQSLMIMPRQLPGDSAALAALVVSAGAGQCGAANEPPPPVMPPQYALMPRLYPPAGAAYRGGSSGSGTSRARLNTTMTPSDLALHFGAQFLEQDWFPGSQAESDDLVAHTFRRTDERGVSWQALLSITATGDDRYLNLSLAELR